MQSALGATFHFEPEIRRVLISASLIVLRSLALLFESISTSQDGPPIWSVLFHFGP